MTDIESRARDALNDVAKDRWKNDRRCLWTKRHTRKNTGSIEAMCRALEAHDATKAEFEAFRRDVSEAVKVAKATMGSIAWNNTLSRFILPEPVDQWRDLRDALESAGVDGPTISEVICGLRDRGLTITKEQPHD